MAPPKSIPHRRYQEQRAVWLLVRYVLRYADIGAWSEAIDGDSVVQRWLFGRVFHKSTVQAVHVRCQALFDSLDPRCARRRCYPQALAHISERFGINETERKIVWLGILMAGYQGFRNGLEYIECDVSTKRDASRFIARLIDVPENEVLGAIGLTGHLTEIGLLESVGHYLGLREYLTVPQRIVDAMTESTSPQQALASLLQTARPGTLNADDFAHVHDDFVHVCRYLQSVLPHKTRGVNILFHGQPGTGKTELAALIARQLDIPLYVVPEDQGNGQHEREQTRLSAYRMAQALLSATSSLIVFDDVEDGLIDLDRHSWRTKSPGKALINRLLESNPVPAIWITNVANRFDAAHLRRFDMVVGFKTLPRTVRCSMIAKQLRDLPLSPAFQSMLADDRELTPAQIGTIARVVGRMSHDPSTRDDLESMATRMYRSAYQLRFGRHPDPAHNAAHALPFDLEFVNGSMSADMIVALFRQSTGLTACFYGAPGTGKSALAAHIARAIDKPLLVKHASDVLRPYLGETEMALRNMFDEATDDGAVLLIDEADSFLQDRTGAQRSWEITQVNELLTNIERFRGHFIATTNAFAALDKAVHRRFDVKVQFHALRPEQRRRLFDALLHRLGLNAHPSPAVVSAHQTLDGLTQLTPGDFAVVARRLSMIGTSIDVSLVIDALADEHRYKAVRTSIGFTA